MTKIRFILCFLIFTTIPGCNSRGGDEIEPLIDSDGFFNNGLWKISFFIIVVIGLGFLIYNYFQKRNNKYMYRKKSSKTSKKRGDSSESYKSLMNANLQYQKNEERLKRKIFDLEKENKKLKEAVSRLQNQSEVEVDEYDQEQSLAEEELISNPIQLTVTNVISDQNSESSILYAGKPTEDGELINIHTNIHETESVFKLTMKNVNQAEFEVIIPSKIIERHITNAPSDFLYRVCNHVNSNREFTKEIITLEKGVAELVDGKWIVKETNKALIKFQ